MKWEDKMPVKKNNVILREIKGESLLIPTLPSDDHNLILFSLNETGRFMWGLIDGSRTGGGIVKALIKQYDVKEEVARKDIDSFLSLLREKSLISFRGV